MFRGLNCYGVIFLTSDKSENYVTESRNERRKCIRAGGDLINRISKNYQR